MWGRKRMYHKSTYTGQFNDVISKITTPTGKESPGNKWVVILKAITGTNFLNKCYIRCMWYDHTFVRQLTQWWWMVIWTRLTCNLNPRDFAIESVASQQKTIPFWAEKNVASARAKTCVPDWQLWAVGHYHYKPWDVKPRFSVPWNNYMSCDRSPLPPLPACLELLHFVILWQLVIMSSNKMTIWNKEQGSYYLTMWIKLIPVLLFILSSCLISVP